MPVHLLSGENEDWVAYRTPLMTLEQIRIFLCVAELCHVTQAAQRLNLTQSAVSAAIAALERQHDVKLFDRVGRGIMLTEAGNILIPAAKRLLREAEATRVQLANMSREPHGQLRIWASQTIASYWLAPRMIDMHRAWPQVEMTLHDGNTDEVANAVLDGSADLGFVEGDVPTTELTRREVGHDELLLIMSRQHPLARKPVLTATDYRTMNWLLREPGSGTRKVMEQHLADMGLKAKDLSVLLQLPTNEAIVAGVRASKCVSMLSWRAVTQARSGDLALRRITWTQRPRRSFLALTDPRRFQTNAVTGFLQMFEVRQIS